MSSETTNQVEPTPGDWQYHDTGRLIKCGPHIIIGFIHQDDEVRSRQVAANGYVMAAAPELLEACEMVFLAGITIDGSTEQEREIRWVDALAAVMAAIDKARRQS